LIDFAAFGPVEENPDGKVVREVFETVFDAGGNEHHVMRLKRLPSLPANEFTSALRDYIDFVAGMWRLWINDVRSIQFGYERTMLEHGNDVFFLGTGQTADGFGKIYLDASVATHGDGDNNTLQCDS
jgi:hypothetical protein